MNEKTKKIVISSVIAVILIILLSVVIKIIFFKDMSTSKLVNLSIFDPENLIHIEKDGKYGYISTQGEMVIEPKYNSATDFFGEYAIVSKNDNNQEKYVVINKKEEEKFVLDTQEDIKYIADYNIWIIKNKLYDKNLKQISEDEMVVSYVGKGYLSYINKKEKNAGVINVKGKEIYKHKFKNNNFNFSVLINENNQINEEVYAVVTINDLNDKEENAIISCKNGKKLYNFTNEKINANQDNIFEILDENNNIVSVMYIENNKIAYKLDGNIKMSFNMPKYKILEINDKTKNTIKFYNIITEESFDYMPNFDENKIYSEKTIERTNYNIYLKNSKYGIMRKKRIIINAEYDEIQFLPINLYSYIEKKDKKQIVLLVKDYSTIVYDLKKKEEIFKFNSNIVFTSDKSSFIQAQDNDSNEKIVYNCITKKSMNFAQDLEIIRDINYIIVQDKTNNTKTYYNTDLVEFYKTKIL